MAVVLITYSSTENISRNSCNPLGVCFLLSEVYVPRKHSGQVTRWTWVSSPEAPRLVGLHLSPWI